MVATLRGSMSGPFSSPSTEAEPLGDLPVGTPWIVIIACIALGISGVMQGMTGLQVIVFANVYSALWVVPWIMMLLGASATACAAFLYDCRWGLGLFGWIATVSCLLLNAAWNVYAVLGGMFSLMAWLSLPVAVIPALIVPFAIPSARRTHRARVRLAGASWV
jgi:hypothetical protein